MAAVRTISVLTTVVWMAVALPAAFRMAVFWMAAFWMAVARMALVLMALVRVARRLQAAGRAGREAWPAGSRAPQRASWRRLAVPSPR
jgi:hypothetical protein